MTADGVASPAPSVPAPSAPALKPGEVRVVVDVSKIRNSFQRSLVNELHALGGARLRNARTARRVRELFSKLTRYGIIVPAPVVEPPAEAPGV